MKLNKFCYIFIFAALFGIISSGVLAQDDNKPAKQPPPNLESLRQLKLNTQQIGEQSQLQLVRQLMGRGAFISAADLLETMYTDTPSNVEVINLLLRCYQELKATEKAEFLLQKRISEAPFDYSNYSRLVELYMQTGRDSLAGVYIEKTLESFPGNPEIYSFIVGGLVRQNYYDVALSYIERGRDELANENLFAMDAARIYETRREYNPAVIEYFKAISLDSLSAKNAERRMSMLIRYPDAPGEIIKSMQSILDTVPENKYALKFIQEAYIKNNQYEDAFNVCLKLDSLTENNGSDLFRYMRVCRDRKMYDQIIRIVDYIERQNYATEKFGDYLFFHAEALAGVGKYDEAILRYEKIVSTLPRKYDKGDALMAIGKIYRNNLNDLDLARTYYDSVANKFPNTNLYTQSLEEIGSLYLNANKLDSAKIINEKLLVKYRRPEDKEATEFRLAMIQFYNRDFENANMSFRKLIAQYPRGYYVNDALINSLIISESQMSFPDALNDYAGVIFYDARQMPDSMSAGYRKIIARGESTLSGLAHVRLSEYLIGIADTAGAINLIEELENYKTDYFYPYGLKLKGDILASEQATEEAIKIYQTILEEYDRYPFAGEVRTILQDLTGQKPAS